MRPKNAKLTEDIFYRIREQVLGSWPTGHWIDLEESVEYLRSLPPHKSFPEVLAEAKKVNRVLLQPRGGVATITGQTALLEGFIKAGADVMPVTIDSYTRQNAYLKSEQGLSESLTKDTSVLNGFPAVNHGLRGCRKLSEAIPRPLQARHGSPDGRLLAEIIHASGWTSNEGGGISYNIPYSKKASLESSIFNWQYCDRLVGVYEEKGISLNREPFGPLTGTLVPPSISNAIAIMEGLLAAEQGVKNISLGFGSVGHVSQDIAAMKSLRMMASRLFKEFGYDVNLSTVYHQWMGNFPREESEAYSVINLGSLTSVLAGATKMIIKTPHEAEGIPTLEANMNGIRTSHHMVKMIRSQLGSLTIDVSDEMEIIQEETMLIIDEVFRLGKGDLAEGIIESFAKGVLDIPFAPSIYNHGAVMPIRDYLGAIRIVEFGNLPFNAHIKALHQERIAKRERLENKKVNHEMIVNDIFSVSNGDFFQNGTKG
ncbi:methylaspartate mutase subunit E [Rossellomorea marisflavi]|jgi:methylaspartate mutase epsilon subunit|uniref:methylaspartate mutase subunit E n=1 Tax=Rossellomorea marisflavi TaxID=189381 RepID=UPI002853203B|nr:methylaspartate mutase subunit E [Rossellomorea marisflavi]MDR4938173.1 methylaspartate mutase subunit E [Rossellomorea marisflavi]